MLAEGNGLSPVSALSYSALSVVPSELPTLLSKSVFLKEVPRHVRYIIDGHVGSPCVK